MFKVYLNNIYFLIYDQLLHLETIIFNRRDGTTKKLHLRNNIKAVNRDAQLTYETRDGQTVEPDDGEMPFDLHADVIRIADGDRGLWYMDALGHPCKYEGKNVELKGKAIAAHVGGIPDAFVSGRYAMVYRANDTSLIGLLCHYEHTSNLVPKDWAGIMAQIVAESNKEHQGGVLVLYVKQLTEVLPLDDELMYLN